MPWYYGWRPYVPVAQRRAKAKARAAKLAKKEKRALEPIQLSGRTIASSFWGKAWCDNLESYSDYDNRLPRGRSYVRNGSVIDLRIDRGRVRALVSGSDLYTVSIDIKTLPPAVWERIKKDCARSIDSLLDLLQGRFDRSIMERLSQADGGMFPQPREIKLACSCPDWAGMCKHVAATLYGVGARLDNAPELLFTLRDVDHLELICQAVDSQNLQQAFEGDAESSLAGSDLGEVFGIDLDTGSKTPVQAQAPPRPRSQKIASKREKKPKRILTKARETTAAKSSKGSGGKKPKRSRAGMAKS